MGPIHERLPAAAAAVPAAAVAQVVAAAVPGLLGVLGVGCGVELGGGAWRFMPEVLPPPRRLASTGIEVAKKLRLVIARASVRNIFFIKVSEGEVKLTDRTIQGTHRQGK
jgi:hypothetical protein